MRRIIFVSIFVLCLLFFVKYAYAVDFELFNQLIDQTNFIVDAACSGTLLSVRHKLVLTNWHCIQDKLKMVERNEVQPNGTVRKVKREIRQDVSIEQKSYKEYKQVGRSEYIGEILTYDRKRDLALLQIKADTIPHTKESIILPDGQKLIRGERVYIVGNPGMMDASVVEGVISSLNRSIEWEPDEIAVYFQFSGGVFGGNSGGAAYNDELYLIGIPAAGNRLATFIGLAIPIDVVKIWVKEECWSSLWDNTSISRDVCLAQKSGKVLTRITPSIDLEEEPQ